jgi:BclB C-terminal domain-containing protein
MLSSSSGQPAVTTTVLGGVGNTVTVLPINGTGAVSGVPVVGSKIDATGSGVAGLAQPITGDRTLTGIDGRFTNNAAMSLVGSTLSLEVEVWASAALDNVFTRVPGASCTLGPALTGIVPIGTVGACSTTGLTVPLTDQTQVILVVRSTVTAGLDVASALTGYWSAGLALS